jgi:hypothetical protein
VSYTGTIQNGVVVLPRRVKLPEGTKVKVQTVETSTDDDSLLKTVLKIAKPRPHWPKDSALNHNANGGTKTSPTLYDLSSDLCGSLSGGASDLARNKTHLKNYGQWKR